MDVEVAMRAVTARLGRFHLVTCSLLSLVYVYQAMFNLSYIFTTMRSEYRCLVPECETDATLAEMQPSWLALAVPAADACRRFGAVKGADGACVPGAFSNETVPCDSWVYPNKDLSIMTEWDMTCSLSNDWKLALVGSANNLGRAVGLPLFGLVSDALGRRMALLAGLTASFCLGIARSLAPNYITFISLEFLDPVFYDGTGGAAFIMGMELMPDRSRGAWSALGHVIFALGFSLLGGVAWLLPRWRLLLRVVYGSSLLCLAAVCWVPESVRWLASKGRTEEALRVLHKAAAMNGLPLAPAPATAPADPKHKVAAKKVDSPVEVGVNDQRVAAARAPRPSLAVDMKEFAHSRILVLRLIACCVSWIGILFVYDGLAVYSVALAGNRYLNFVLVELVEVPSALITWKMMAAVGRRATLVGSLLPAAACCFAYHFLPADAFWPRTTAVVLAKLCITVAFTDCYVLSAEMFPTRVRHTMYSLSATFGRFGSVLAPQMPLLAAVMDTLPLLVFGGVCLCCVLLALTFPETARVALPDSVAEAEAIGRRGSSKAAEAPSAA